MEKSEEIGLTTFNPSLDVTPVESDVVTLEEREDNTPEVCDVSSPEECDVKEPGISDINAPGVSDDNAPKECDVSTSDGYSAVETKGNYITSPNTINCPEKCDTDVPNESVESGVDIVHESGQQGGRTDAAENPKTDITATGANCVPGKTSLTVRVLYDFDSQPGTGELSIKEGEVLNVTRQDVGEGWWEGSNSQGQAGLFPAAYVEYYFDTQEITAATTAPPAMPPPPLPTEYSNIGAVDWEEKQSGFEANSWNQAQNNTANIGANAEPQKRPLSQQMSYDNEDWDDDWDDDDSEPGTNNYLNGAGNFGLSGPNRAAKSASSVGDVSTAGAGKASVDEKEKVFVEDYGNGSVWRPNPHEFTCGISSPKKESKFHGMKSFIAYSLMPSFASAPVSRRYKHFDWIHGRLSEKFPLIPIPPLPEKQISGRFEEDLIEYRMTMLQSWVDRICRHPVISQCEVFHHFVTCPNDEKLWKTGKRRAENDKLVGANFYLAIERPDTALDVMQTEAKLEGYNRFFSTLDDAVKLVQNTCIDQAKKHQTAFKREYNKISHSFSKLSRAFDTDPSNCAPGLTEAIHHMSEAYSDIGTVFEEEPKHDWDPLCHLLFEYRGLIDGFPSVISITKGAIAKRRQVEKEASEGRLDYDQVPPMVRRSDTIAYALHAEVAHFHQERTRDFKKAMTSFLTEQINFYQKITDRLRDSLEKFNDV
ncbi:sorting nexin-18-like isoform X3 [Homarus americanus]|uniref:sorting nexin-18-like isoform X3 n=1 Tax=Homarus americanus TaxID=6706 RepID=UPI001C487DF2|nr:sorting nexin-18-like isoform X3 [Homarus americanus]